jgi:hypothetical protein
MTDKKFLHGDISDSPEDQKILEGDKGILDLPELKDIPGATRSGKNDALRPGDTTISSADEEADELLEDDGDSDDDTVSPAEKKLLNQSLDPSYDADLPIESLSLDDEDNEGEHLEEAGQDNDLFGQDLDDDLIEEEDEETDGETQQ